MRILFISNNYTPYTGGVVSSIDTTVQALQKQGYTIMLITLNFLGKKHDDPEWVRRVPSIIRFRFKQNYMAIPLLPTFYIQQWIHEFCPDIIHVHHPFLLGTCAVRIAKKLGIKIIFTYHTMYEEYAHYLGLPECIVQPIIKRVVLKFCKNVDHIIAPSSGVQEYLKNKGIRHVTVLPSSISPLFLNQPFMKKELQEPYKLLYVGRFTKEKNIPVLLDIVAQLPKQYHFTLIGYGEYTTYLKKYAYTDRGLSLERVTFVIKPEKNTLLSCYQKSHLFLFASQTDTQALVLAEAMASSMPIVALDGFGQRDIIASTMNGFLVNSANEMIQKIVILCNSQEYYNKLQKEAYITAQKYSPDAFIEKIVYIYHHM